MKLKDKLFTMAGDQPYLTPVGINLKEFQELWNADKSTDKSQYAIELAIVYHMCDFESPFYEMKNKEQEIFQQYGKPASWKMPPRVKKCIELYTRLQSSPEKRGLDASISLCDSISDSLGTYTSDTKQLDVLLKELDKEIDGCKDDVFTKLEIIKQKNAVKKEFLDNAKTATDLIPKLEKQFDSLVKMRVKVAQAQNAYDDNNTSSINNNLMDELLNEINYEQSKNKE